MGGADGSAVLYWSVSARRSFKDSSVLYNLCEYYGTTSNRGYGPKQPPPYLPSPLGEEDGISQHHLIAARLAKPRWLAGQHGTCKVAQIRVTLTLERHA